MKVTEASIRRLLKKWRPRLGLDRRWVIEVQLHSSKDTWPKRQRGNVAFVLPACGYFQATMCFNVKEIEKAGESLEHIVLHELVHIIIDPLATIAKNALGEDHDDTYRMLMESTVETVTRALLNRK